MWSDDGKISPYIFNGYDLKEDIVYVCGLLTASLTSDSVKDSVSRK